MEPHLSPFSRLRFCDLRSAWRAAISDIEQRRSTVDSDWDRLCDQVAAGETTFEEVDEDGQVVYDHGEVIGERLYEIETAERLVNEAFAVSFWHLLERTILEATKEKYITDTQARAFLDAYPEPLRTDVSRAAKVANMIKHGRGKAAQALLLEAPHLFDPEALADAEGVAGPEALLMSEELMKEIVKTIDNALPKFRGLPLAKPDDNEVFQSAG